MKQVLFNALAKALEEERSCVLATLLEGAHEGCQGLFFAQASGEDAPLDPPSDLPAGFPLATLRQQALEHLARGASATAVLETRDGPVEVFFECHRPPPKLILVGAVHAAIPLVHFARELGFHTVVIDPRGTFATAERFGHAQELRRQWPREALQEIPLHEEIYLATLSHDPKIDLPALEAVLRSPVRYIGALGSKKTHGKRVAALQEKGFTEAEISRIHAPIGLDLGGRSPAEIALAVMAQVVAVANGRNASAR